MDCGMTARVTRIVREPSAVREVEKTGYGNGTTRPVGEADAGSAAGAAEPLDIESIEAIGDEIATLAAEIASAESRLLERIAQFHGLNGWLLGGHRTCAHWLSFRTGYLLATAREYVRVALALQNLPVTGAAMARGALSFCKARALTRVAKPETESDLLTLAEGATTAQLERMVRAWRLNSRLEEEDLERQRRRARRFSIVPENGMYAVRGLLPGEGGASAQRAIDEISDELYRAELAAGLVTEDDTRAAAARRRADALVVLIERGIAATAARSRQRRDGAGGGTEGGGTEGGGTEGGGTEGGGTEGGGTEGGGTEGGGTDAGTGAVTGAAGAPTGGTRAERYQVVLHVDAGTLEKDGETGRSHLEDGTRVSYETSRRLACDAGLVRVEYAEDGKVLGVGRRTRSIPTPLGRALELRDQGCRFPGCDSRWTERHHVVHWADGGETNLKNTVLLCYFHHTLVHEGGWSMQWWNERDSSPRVAFTDRRGQMHVGGRVPRPPELPADEDAGKALMRRNREAGVAPDAHTAGARWKRERDIPDAVLFRAIDAGMG